jgi:hypothetical protein
MTQDNGKVMDDRLSALKKLEQIEIRVDERLRTDRMELLRKREAALKATIAAEQVKRQKRKEKDHIRLVVIVGEALIQQAARVPDFELMLGELLKSITDEKSRRFLSSMGYLQGIKV